jgi:hypothetical protein
MSWTYRIVRTTLPDGGIRYAIHEAVYADLELELEREATVYELEKLGISWTEDPVGPEFYIQPWEQDDPKGAVLALRQELMDMFKTTTWPIINGDSENGKPLLAAVALTDDV